MRFTKMEGCGNDYVYVDCTKEALPEAEKTAAYVSDRHFGIGSDGLILICPSKTADVRMEMYNMDGSLGKMCGNGIRCVAKYAYDHGLTDKTTLRVETASGVKTLKLYVEDGKVCTVRVDMGEPLVGPECLPASPEAAGLPADSKLIDQAVEVGGKEYRITCVSMGNPHCVIFVDEDVAQIPLDRIGPLFEKHPMFPEGVNTEFVRVKDRSHLQMRVWERGSGETLACGTGTCASAYAAFLGGLAEPEVEVELLGGSLRIEYDKTSGRIFMTGPAREVFTGEIALPWE